MDKFENVKMKDFLEKYKAKQHKYRSNNQGKS